MLHLRRNLIHRLAAVIAVLIATLPTVAEDDPPFSWTERAVRLEAEGDLAGAATVLARALDELPTRETSSRATVGNHLARLYFSLGRYEDALRTAAGAAAEAEAGGDLAEQAFAEFMVGMVHRHLRQHDEALAAFRASARLAQDAGDREQWLRASNEESNVMVGAGDLDGALARKLEILRLAGPDVGGALRVSLENDLAYVYSSLDRHAEAEPHFRRAFDLALGLGLEREAAVGAFNLAYTAATLGDLEAAISWARRSLDIASERGLAAEEHRAHDMLGGLLAATGEFEAAVGHLQTAAQLQDRLMNEESARRIAELGSRHEAERRQAEIELLRRDAAIRDLELAQERSRRRLLLVGLAGLVGVLGVLGVAYRMQLAATRQVRAANLELDAANRRVEELARTDALTGLANRRSVEERLAEEARRSARTHRPFAVVVADLDHFKRVNDAFGHDIGDSVLREVARRLHAGVRAIDLAGRWGGEEFLLVLPDTDSAGAREVAEKLRRVLRDSPVRVGALPLEVTLTLGVAENRGEEVESTIRRADEALYRGKREGRDRVVAA